LWIDPKQCRIRRVTHGSSVGGSRQDLARLRSWLEAVGDIARAVTESRPLPDLLDLIAGTTCRLTGYDFCAVLMAKRDPPRLVIEGSHGFSAEYVARINVERPIHLLAEGPLGEGPTSRAYRSLRAVAVRTIATDPTFGPWAELAAEEGYRSLLSVPVVASGTAVGVLNCYTIEEQAFPLPERGLVETLADEAAIAIEAAGLRAREQATIADLERLNASLEWQRAQLERTEALHRELMAVTLTGDGLPAIVEAVSRAVGQPVWLYGSEVPAIPAGRRRGGTAGSVDVPIVLDGFPVGYLASEVGDPTSMEGSLTRRALESGALLAALQLQRERTAQEVQSRLSRDLLGDVLSADETIDEWPVQKRASQLGHDLTRPHTVLVVRPDAASANLAGLEPMTLQRRVLGAVSGVVERPSPRPLVATRNENVVVLWAPRSDDDRTEPREIAERIQRRVRESLGPITVSVAIGATCRHLQEYVSAYRVAAAALDLPRRGRSREAILSLAELGVYQFLLQVRRPRELAEFATSLLDPLRASERSSLLATLRAYLENGMSTAQTAKALFVHVNTVAYRLRRIEEVLGLDLGSPDVLVNLRFALMVDEIMSL
jgi:DNA-binding PucR family transcriptional regulator